VHGRHADLEPVGDPAQRELAGDQQIWGAIWTTTGLIFGELLGRFVKPDVPAPAEPNREPIGASR